MPTYQSRSPGETGVSIYRTWTNSPPGTPHNLPMPLDFLKRSGKGHKTYGTGSYAQGFIRGYDTFPGGNPRTPAANKALERMREVCDGVTATIGTAVVEYRSSFEMIAKRGGQLAQAFSAVKQGKLKRAARLLGLKKVPKGARTKVHSKNAGSLWLEYWMGWAPSVSDVHNAIKVLNSTAPSSRLVKTSATESRSYASKMTINGSDPLWATDYYFDSAVRVTVKLGAKVILEDNTRHAAHRLGLLSPLTTAWEVTPWSWFVGWFSNVGTWLDSFNWFRGLKIVNSYTTTVMEGHDIYYSIRRLNGDRSDIRNDKTFSCVRTLGWPSYTLVAWDPPSRLSISRAATAISLLVQHFKR